MCVYNIYIYIYIRLLSLHAICKHNEQMNSMANVYVKLHGLATVDSMDNVSVQSHAHLNLLEPQQIQVCRSVRTHSFETCPRSHDGYHYSVQVMHFYLC